ncbi:hypothetical protein C8J56DRAFT_34690 [Mycena floridula]|nr:hypothetical protein C8J56DRAFT_34690 [Mycena floridula]
MHLSEYHREQLQLPFNPGPDEYRGSCERDHADFVWVHLQPFLAAAVYKLRPRFHRQWKPSWLPGGSLAGKNIFDCEDHLGAGVCWAALDATRIQDGEKVVLKIVYNETDEAKICSFFSSFPDDSRGIIVSPSSISFLFPNDNSKSS